MRSGEWHVHHLHHLPIELRHLQREMCGHIIRLQLSIEMRIDFHGRITCHQCSIQLMVLKCGRKGISRQTIGGIMHFIHRSLHVEISLRRKEIKPFAIGMKVHRYIEKRILRKELTHVEVVHHQISQVGILGHIILGIKTGGTAHLEIIRQGKRIIMDGQLRAVHQSLGSCLGLLEQEIQAHFSACHGENTIQFRSSTYSKLPISERTKEAHVLRFGRKIDFTSPTG